jgi:hypothetical protein
MSAGMWHFNALEAKELKASKVFLVMMMDRDQRRKEKTPVSKTTNGVINFNTFRSVAADYSDSNITIKLRSQGLMGTKEIGLNVCVVLLVIKCF